MSQVPRAAPVSTPFTASNTETRVNLSRLERIISLHTFQNRDQRRIMSRVRETASRDDRNIIIAPGASTGDTTMTTATTINRPLGVDRSSCSPSLNLSIGPFPHNATQESPIALYLGLHSGRPDSRTPTSVQPLRIVSTVTAAHHPSSSVPAPGIRSNANPAAHAASSSTTDTVVRPRNLTPLKMAVHSHPTPFIILSTLITLVLASIMGWLVFINRMTVLSSCRKEEGEQNGGGLDSLILVGDGAFVALLLILLGFLFRQVLRIISLLRPAPLTLAVNASSSDMLPTTATSGSILPQWIVRPPPYTYATREARTGDVEDIHIVASGQGENLPLYGDVRGSKLLLRSESRGEINLTDEAEGRDNETQSGMEEEEASARVETVVLYPVPPPNAAATVTDDSPSSGGLATDPDTGNAGGNSFPDCTGRGGAQTDRGTKRLAGLEVKVELESGVEESGEGPCRSDYGPGDVNRRNR